MKAKSFKMKLIKKNSESNAAVPITFLAAS